MKLSKHTGKLGCVALAAAVAGTFAITPVASAQQPSLLADLADLANKAGQVLPSADDGPAGSGSYAAHFASAGWSYTALAHNPANDRIYAISKAEQGKPAGHLLRIHPVTGELRDLGKLLVSAELDPSTVSAAFTRTGTLVLDSGDELHTLDLSQDASGTPVDGELKLDTQELVVRGKTDAELPHAWGSLGGDADADTLYGVSTGPDAKSKKDVPYLWTLDVEAGRMSAAPLAVAKGVDASKVGELNYAYTNRAGNLVFADDAANTVEVKGADSKPLVIAAAKGKSITENYLNLASLRAGSWYKPASEPQTTSAESEAPAPRVATKATEPTTSSSSAAPAPSSKAPAPVVPTEVAEVTEPSASTSTSSEAPAAPRDVLVTVADEDGRAVRDYDVIVNEDPSIYAKTDREGQARLSLPAELADVHVDAGGELHPVEAGETSLRVQFHAGETTTPSSTPQTDTPVINVADVDTVKKFIYLLDSEGNILDDVDVAVVGTDWKETTDDVGRVELRLPISEENRNVPAQIKIVDEKIAARYANPVFDVRRDDENQDIRLKLKPATTTTTADAAELEEKTVKITLVDEKFNNLRGVALLDREGDEIDETSSKGEAKITIPKGVKSLRVKPKEDDLPKGYKGTYFTVDRTMDGDEIRLKKESSSDKEYPKKDVRITVVDEDQNPVEGAVLMTGNTIIGVTGANGVAVAELPKSDDKFVRITLDEAPEGYNNGVLVFDRSNNAGEIVLGRSGDAKTRPQEILEVIKEVEPVLKGVLGPLGALAGVGGALGAAGKGGGAKGTGTSTSTTSTSYSRANMTGGVSTGRSTSAAPKKKSVVKRTVKSTSRSGGSDSTSDSTRDGDLAETGTPMTTVITLGILLLLIGGAYVFVGRRRENE